MERKRKASSSFRASTETEKGLRLLQTIAEHAPITAPDLFKIVKARNCPAAAGDVLRSLEQRGAVRWDTQSDGWVITEDAKPCTPDCPECHYGS